MPYLYYCFKMFCKCTGNSKERIGNSTMRTKNKIVKILAVFLLLLNIPALAETVNIYNGVGGYDPGVIDHFNLMQIKSQEDRKRNQAAEEQRGKEQIDVNIKNEIDKLPNKEVSFILNSIRLSGNTAFTEEELLHHICPRVGSEVTINELIEYCNLLTDYYQQRGYLSTVAYMAPQKVLDGNVDIIIAEGKFGNITIEGNKWAREKFLRVQHLEDKKINKY